jgi:hypothetical protein
LELMNQPGAKQTNLLFNSLIASSV